MHRIRSLCKRAAQNILPYSLLQLVKKVYYYRLLNSFTLEEEPDLKIVQHLLTPGDYVVDIGANIGIYSKFLSELVGYDGHVYSIEPIPETFEILCSNLHKLHIENVEPMNCAVSDSETIVTMEIPHKPIGGINYYQASIVKDGATKSKKLVKVPAITIDSKFCGVSQAISLIKCDVEGHELACIKGAQEFLARSQPIWLIEVSGDPDDTESSAHVVFQQLAKNGYSAWWFDGTTLRKRGVGDRSINYFFLIDNHIRILKERAPKLVSIST